MIENFNVKGILMAEMSGVTFFGVRIQSGSIDLNSISNPTPRIFSKP